MVQIPSPTAFLAGGQMVNRPALSPLQAKAMGQQMAIQKGQEQRAVAQEARNVQTHTTKMGMLSKEQRQEELKTNLARFALALHTASAVGDNQQAQEKVIQQHADLVQGTGFDSVPEYIMSKPFGDGKDSRNEAIIKALAVLKAGGVYGQDEADVTKKQKGSTITIKNPETGESKVVVPSYDPVSGKLTLADADIPTGWEITSTEGLTPTEKKDIAVETTAAKKEAEISQAAASEYADQAVNIGNQLVTFDELINTVDEAIESGKFTGQGIIAKYLPKFNQTSVELSNLGKRMGLDIIAAGKFGPLSEGEMKVAMDTAKPDNLSPEGLKAWATKRRTALEKLQTFYMDAATFIGSEKPDGTGRYKKQDFINKLKAEKQGAAPTTTPAAGAMSEISDQDLLKAF